jgi:penicillin-binding protein 1A
MRSQEVEIRRRISTAEKRISSIWTSRGREVAIGALMLLLIALLPAVGVLRYVYFDRENLFDIEPFIRFELPTTGVVLDSQGEPLIEFAREYRHVLSYDEIPEILRQAILAAEDHTFFSHRSVAYRAFPRVDG